MYWGFYDSGFTITGNKRVNYQEQETIQFNTVYLPSLGLERSVKWRFYKSDTYDEIGDTNNPLSGTIAGRTFTYAEGKNGIEVEMSLDFGIHRTKFRKRTRVVIIPNKTTPTKTLDISTIPMLSGGVVFSNSATASVTNGDANVTTSAAHGASVGDIIVLIKDSVSRTYKAITGTTGNTIVLDRPYEGTTGTVTNTNTRRGLDIQHRFNASGVWVPGDIVHLTGTLYTARCRFININGTSGNEIWITIPNDNSVLEFIRMGTAQDDVFQLNDSCNHIRFIGDKDSNGNYRWKLTNGGFSAQHFATGNTTDCHNIRISCIKVFNADSTGIKPKLDAVNRAVGAWDDCWVYDNDVRNSTNEGIYAGYFKYDYDAGFNGGGYHHAMKRYKNWANYTAGCGWDGNQGSGCDESAEMYYNFMYMNATSQTGSQNFGAVMNGGWKGHFYNNIVIGNTSQCLAFSDTYIYSNIIYNTTYGNALFIRRADNSFNGSPSYTVYDPEAKMFVWGNILCSLNDPIYILDISDQGTAVVPLRQITIVNNTLVYTGTVVEGYIRYNEPASGQTRTTTPNITSSPNPAVIDFQDISTQDTRLKSTSIIFAPNSFGTDISSIIDVTTLPLRMFTDISDQIVPENGDWRQGAHHEYVGHESELAAYIGRTQIQKYQTAQTDNTLGWSDREKICRFFGGNSNRMNLVGSSAKPRYLTSVKAYPNLGTPSNETFDDVSLL